MLDAGIQAQIFLSMMLFHPTRENMTNLKALPRKEGRSRALGAFAA